MRWVIGNTSFVGYRCLKYAIRNCIAIYGDQFYYVVCYNNSDLDLLKEHLRGLNISLYQQEIQTCPIPNRYIPVTDVANDQPEIAGGSMWKYCPPRLEFNNREIIMDNDVVLVRRLEEIEEFLSSNFCLIAEDEKTYYGKYENRLPSNVKYNTGILGLPPKYDFDAAIRQTWELYEKLDYMTHADEQGLIGLTFQRCTHKQIPFAKVPLVRENKPIPVNAYGYHFSNCNRPHYPHIYMDLISRTLNFRRI